MPEFSEKSSLVVEKKSQPGLIYKHKYQKVKRAHWQMPPEQESLGNSADFSVC